MSGTNIRFSCAIIACQFTFLCATSGEQFIATNFISSTGAQLTEEKLKGRDLLFDLEEEPYETTNLYYESNYQAKLSVLQERSKYWQSRVGLMDDPDMTRRDRTWNTYGGVIPWVTDSSTRTISQKYSYKSAPHVVLFLVDDWGWNDVGYQSTYMNWTTPNIDLLASKGIKLTNYYSHEVCTPSRAALMTGRYALRFGMHGAIDAGAELQSTEATIAEELKSAGYRTNIVGKWHLGMSSLSKTPTYRGFDHFYGFLAGFIDYYTKLYGDFQDFRNDVELISDKDVMSESVHSETAFTTEAIRIISEHADKYSEKPLFLYFASQLMHQTWAADPSYLSKCVDDSVTTAQQTYCAMNLMLDYTVGQIMCALDSNNMLDNTLFIMISDNGGTNDMPGNNYPFRGAKGSPYRGGDSVPGFVYSTSKSIIPKSRQGGVYAGQMHVTDWLPTIMGLATYNKWSGSVIGNDIDGVDMWEAIVANTDTKHTEIIHYLDKYGNVSMQIDMLKMIRFNGSSDTVTSGTTPEHVFSIDQGEITTCESDEYYRTNNINNTTSGVGVASLVVIMLIALKVIALALCGVKSWLHFRSPKNEGYETVADNDNNYIKGEIIDCDEHTPLRGTSIDV